MRPTAPMFPRSTRRSSILSRPSGRRSEPLVKNATVVLAEALAVISGKNGGNGAGRIGRGCFRLEPAIGLHRHLERSPRPCTAAGSRQISLGYLARHGGLLG